MKFSNPLSLPHFLSHFLALWLGMAAASPVAAEQAYIIDTHLHAMSCKQDGLEKAAAWMAAHGVSQAIVHPLEASRPKYAHQRKRMLANHEKHRGRIHRFCIIAPDEVASVAEAVAILKQEKQDGAIGFGEHYGDGLWFDDPKNMRLFKACEEVGLPVMFHLDRRRNMDKPGFPHLENAIKAHPKLIFIAHGPNWWKAMSSGHCDRLLGQYPNLYADLSAGSGANALLKDMDATAVFMKRHAKKLLFATDCGWWTFDKEDTRATRQFEIMRSLDLSDSVKADIYHGNAMRLFGLAK